MKINKVVYGGGLIGVVALGIFTNALWDLLKPLSRFVFEAALNISILGIDALKDGIYKEIAKGFHEGTSLQIFIIINTVFFAFVFCVVISMFIIRQKLSSLDTKSGNKGILNRLINYNIAAHPYFGWFLSLYLLFAGTIFIFDQVREKYINNAGTHFQQLLKIARPYISDEESLLYVSSFSQIRNKSDYVQVISSLEKISTEHGQIVPEFSFTF